MTGPRLGDNQGPSKVIAREVDAGWLVGTRHIDTLIKYTRNDSVALCFSGGEQKRAALQFVSVLSRCIKGCAVFKV